MLIVRKMIIEKKMEMQKVKHRIKLYKMMNPQVWLLNEWAKMEKKNDEFVSRLTRKLLALSTCWPLYDVKVYVHSFSRILLCLFFLIVNIHNGI